MVGEAGRELRCWPLVGEGDLLCASWVDMMEVGCGERCRVTAASQ